MGWLGIRTIRGQLTAGILLLQIGFTALFAGLVLRADQETLRLRSARRLQFQMNLLADVSGDALFHKDIPRLMEISKVMLSSASVRSVGFTDARGQVLAWSKNSPESLTPNEVAKLREAGTSAAEVLSFRDARGERESVVRIRGQGQPPAPTLGYALLRENGANDREEMDTLLKITGVFGLLGVLASIVASALLARTISGPLRKVMEATRRLIRDPETKEGFPLVVHEKNEAAELANAFNLMVLSMEEQRAGLSDTLALLDSMLAHAPIGFAFFDRKHRYVRVNHYMADKTGIPMTRYLGRSVDEVFPAAPAALLTQKLDEVFATGVSVQDFEFDPTGEGDGELDGAEKRSWLINVYPVRTGHQAVRWVGAVVMDTTERRRAEETLRRTEKLAATGRLAASIAHEINNPLEAATNLIYLLRKHPRLDAAALEYADMAEHQLSRVSEITQQMLRFNRQSTLPVLSNMPELMDSILALYQGRVHALRVKVQRRMPAEVELFCVAGAVRQVFANLIANALDAMPNGGTLHVRVRRSRSWKTGMPGARVVVADNGAGMPESVRRRIFEAFFTTKEATGTGLGLWVSLEILQKHKATVAVCSRSVAGETGGTGTVFMLFFPEDGAPASFGRPESLAQAVAG